ncbi:hypothetical protein ACP4OV_031169 [Aristida adscensionis]
MAQPLRSAPYITMHRETFIKCKRPAALPRSSRQSFSGIIPSTLTSWPMAGGNSTASSCVKNALLQCTYQATCHEEASMQSLRKSIRRKLWRMDALLVVSAILAGLIVVIGAYAQHYRHRPSTRLIFLGATTLFLPMVSSVVSSSADYSNYIMEAGTDDRLSVVAKCDPGQSALVIVWAFLVQLVMFNTSAVVAIHDREGQNRGPPFELLVQGVWTLYLGGSFLFAALGPDTKKIGEDLQVIAAIALYEGIPFALICAKMQTTPPVPQEARQHAGELRVADHAPPPLLVMGEETRQVDRQHNGYVLKDDSGTNMGLVTLDRVWQLDGIMLPSSTPPQQLKDLCLSFASFKLLRCLFASMLFVVAPVVLLLVIVIVSELLKHWDEKISQCSVLEVHPRATPFVLVKHLLCSPGNKTKVKVTSAVKACIIEALRRSNSGNRRQLSNGAASLRQSGFGESFLWACSSKGTSDTILTWHIATSILEVRHPHPLISDHDHNKMVAIHLSRYCAYLVGWCPELLPDNDEWSKDLYKDVKKKAERALAMAGSWSAPETKYQQLTEKLQNSAQQEVLKNGVKLGKQLVELAAQGEESTAWKLLAEFWSEMILFVAPSDNLKGHSEAIARGGELITLLWVLLYHVGIVSRPAGEQDHGAATAAANASAAVV